MEPAATPSTPPARLRPLDYLLLSGLCLVLFGFSAAYERVLTTHETVHCLNVREMLASQDWIIPTYGGRVWLERPPLPHWITALAAAPFGAGEQVWTYRLGSHLCGLICVLLTAWMGSVWFGRGMGILCGAVLATTFEVYQYSTVTEADIGLFLVITCAMACFVKAEFASPGALRPLGFLGPRCWAVAGFFFFLGLTNLAKGLFFGSFFVLVPVGGYLLGNLSWQGMRRYIWLWGWLLCLAAAGAWAFLAWLRYPDIVDLWHSDYIGRLNQGYMKEPFYYYFLQLPLVVMPWFLPAVIGMIQTARVARRPASVERFLWCWALLPIVFFSIPQGKHHHYLLQCMTPWAVLGALGARAIWQAMASAPAWVRNPLVPVGVLSIVGGVAVYLLRRKVPGFAECWPVAALGGPLVVFALWLALRSTRPAVAFAGIFAVLIGVYWAGWIYRSEYLNRYETDMAFVERVRQTVPAGQPVYVKCDYHPLNGSWLLFYLGEETVFLHNLTFLRDENIRETTLYLIARGWDETELRKYGQPEVIDQSAHTRGELNPADRYTLFRFTYRDDLERVSASKVRITPCQATGRALGPILQ